MRTSKRVPCTIEQQSAWEKQAKRDGYKSVSQWIRDILDKSCVQKPEEKMQGWGDHNSPQKN